jgi:hypothetical protein
MRILAALLVIVGLLALVRWALSRISGTLDRSPRQVADILRQFVGGEPTGFLVDDFIHIPITDPRLEEIRNQFERLVDAQPTWEPQTPFPAEAIAELQRLIAEAEALAVGERTAFHGSDRLT